MKPIANLIALGVLGTTLTLLAWSPTARADEADDLQVMIDRERKSGADLSRLDEFRVAADDIAVFNVWLDEAWRNRSEQKFDETRQVLDRVDAQKEMIRARIAASGAIKQAADAERGVQKALARIEDLKRLILEATKRKAALEAVTK
jgi:hypothetical protein